MEGAHIVVIDDEANMGKVLGKLLKLEGYRVDAFQSPLEGMTFLREHDPDVLLSDLRMPEMSGEEVLEKVREQGFDGEVILMTAYGTVESAMRCVRAGAYDYVTKPFDTKALLATVRRAVEKRGRSRQSAPSPPPAAEPMREILGESAQIRAVRELIAKFAPTDSPVLVSGESGTGKELAARAIHRHSARRKARFVAINCASIPETLIESELFGHEKGSFTGAHEQKIGYVEASHGGTLFLDEIGELPLSMQAKLLRTLQEREITRVGAVHPITVDIRVIAATNRRLDEAVASGDFREDLYYRLNVLKIKMPALRERAEDIPLLVEHFLKATRESAGKPDWQFHPRLVSLLKDMKWPGNVRELRNVVERLIVMSDSSPVTEEVLAEMSVFDSQQLDRQKRETPRQDGQIADYRQAREQFDADYLRSVLRASDGNVSEAAKLAGMSRRNFYDKLEKLQIDPGDFK